LSYDETHRFMKRVAIGTQDVVLVCFDPGQPQPVQLLLNETGVDLNTALRTEPEGERIPRGKFVVGRSQQIRKVLDLAQRYAIHDITALITGETGTGKDILAQYVHSYSSRANKPFVACNLASMPETLVESELFGYAKGAFTGAQKDKKGLLEAAEGGTLFLDEIGDLSPTLQVKLLRLLENQEYYRIGESSPRRAKVRIIAATNRDLEQDILEKTFRNDLYYRINSARMQLPPLRERKDDVPLLAEHFVYQMSLAMKRPPRQISNAVHAALLEYSWPGNIRELKNVLESAVMVCNGDTLVVGDLPMHLERHAVENRDTISASTVRRIDAAELNLIRKTLQGTNGNKAMAAEQLGISTRTLYRKIGKLSVLGSA